MTLPLMPKATAVWLIEKTALTFTQIADFCGMHPLEVQAIADGEVAQSIIGYDPVANGQLTQEEIEPVGTFMNQFIGVLVLFSASGMGIFGALNEGMTGDSSLLLTKSLLDFCTAIIFSTSLGIIVTVTVIPQAIVLFSLFFLANIIVPLTTPEMLTNFSAVGGIIMLATGFRITGIREFPVVNMLPALFLIMPFVAWFS